MPAFIPFTTDSLNSLEILNNPNSNFSLQEAGVQLSFAVPTTNEFFTTFDILNEEGNVDQPISFSIGSTLRQLIPDSESNRTNSKESNTNIKGDKHFRIYVSEDIYFEMDMLPAVRQNLSHPHGLLGQAVPGAPPGVTFTQLQNTANIPIPGGAPVVQSLGVNMMTMQFVGAFIGLPRNNEGDYAYWELEETDDYHCALHSTKPERKFYDDPYDDPELNRYPGRAVINKGDEAWHAAYIFSRDVVAEQKEVKISIFTHNYLTVEEIGVITQFVPMLARNDRVYYKFTLLITDYYNELHPRIPKSYVSNVFGSSDVPGQSIQTIDLTPQSVDSDSELESDFPSIQIEEREEPNRQSDQAQRPRQRNRRRRNNQTRLTNNNQPRNPRRRVARRARSQ